MAHDGGDLFPELRARNLEGRALHLPRDFAGVRNVVLVAFQRWHQDLVDSWIPYVGRLITSHPELRVYEVPVLSSTYSLARPFIDGGMRAAIASREVRERTLTTYTDVSRVVRSLGLPGTGTVAILLVDRTGRIHWRGQGGYEPAQAAALERAVGQTLRVAREPWRAR